MNFVNYEYSIKVIKKIREFEDLKSVWEELAEKNTLHRPFLCFDWFKIWFEHFLGNNELMILLLYEENKLAGIAPFFIKEEEFKGIKVKKLELIGNVYSPVRYFLLNSSNDEEKENILFYIFEYLNRDFKRWDIIDLYPIAEENGHFDLLKTALNRSQFKKWEYFCFGDWYLNGINYSGEEYLKRRPGNIRENVPYRIRKLNRVGKLDFKMIRGYDNIQIYMDIYYELYSKSWQERENVGPTFHRDLAKIMAKKGWLRLGFLFLNDTPIACQFWLCANDYAYILKLFYDRNFEKYAPGKILTVEMMKYAIDQDKAKSVDYLHGDEPYKRDWTPMRRERKGIKVYNSTFKGQYLYFLEHNILPLVNKNGYLKKIKDIMVNRFFSLLL